MGIKVGHRTNAGSVAGAAFGAAQSQARAALTPARLAAAERDRARKQAADEAERARQFQAGMQLRGFELGQVGADAAQLRQQDNMRLNADLQGDLADEAFGRSQSAADLAQVRGRQDLEFSLTTRQRMELDQLADAEARAMADPSFSPEEKEELRYRFAQKRAGFAPVARPKPKTAAELFKERTHTDPKTGRIYSLDENGMPGRAIYEPPERRATVQDRVKAWQAALQSSTSAEGKVDEVKAKRIYKAIMEGTEPDFGSPVEPEAAPGESALEPAKPAEGGGLSGLVDNLRYMVFGEPEAAAPDLGTDEGVRAKLVEIGSAAVEKGAINPADAKNLATVDYQLGVARELLKRNEEDFAARTKALETDKSSSSERAYKVFKTTNRVAAGRAKERVAALEKRRSDMLAQKDELEAISIANRIKRSRGQAVK